MTTDRRFCRFNKGSSTLLGTKDLSMLSMSEPPDGGLCLSSFLVITQKEKSSSVLMGHLNPAAPWDHIGALDESRIKVHSMGWMLPSSHLIVHESPQEAAKRILREQVELEDLEFLGPKVVSEVYRPKRFPELPSHWDIEFIFTGKLEQSNLPVKTRAWTELKFVDLDKLPISEIARSHEDILSSTGFNLRR